MSLLKKMSRKTTKEKQNKPVSTRLTDSEFDAFTKLCDDTGYSISEALRLLIQQEIKGVDDQSDTKSLQKYSKSIESSTNNIESSTIKDESSPVVKTPNQPSVQPSTTVNKHKKKPSSGRFSTTKWKIDNFLPCPICNTWVSASNFSRHAKEHNSTTEEVFTKHKDKADQMAKEKRSTQ
jgi:hypothetical protein